MSQRAARHAIKLALLGLTLGVLLYIGYLALGAL